MKDEVVLEKTIFFAQFVARIQFLSKILMPFSDSKENRNSDAETLVSSKNYHFPQSRRHIQFLS